MRRGRGETAAKGGKVKWIVLSAIAAVVVIAGGIGLWAASDVYGWTGSDEAVTVTVEKGASTTAIAEELKEQGIIQSTALFRFYSRNQGADGSYQYGNHTLRANMSYKEIIAALQQLADSDTVAILTIPEGFDVAQIAARLEELGICTGAAFLDALKNDSFEGNIISQVPDSDLKLFKYEGYLFPDTYQFEKGISAHEVAQTLLSNFESKITQEYLDRVAELGWTLDEAIILASIVQSEGFNPEDMKKVSGVFHNRLAPGSPLPKLQSDVTILFLRDSYGPYGITYTDAQVNAYSTYITEGIPEGAICNPGLVAIEATLYPTQHNYLYFVTDGYKQYFYAETFAEHEENVAEASKSW